MRLWWPATVRSSSPMWPLLLPGTDLRIFAKPEVHGHRRMAVALAVGESEADARAKAGLVADALTITVE